MEQASNLQLLFWAPGNRQSISKLFWQMWKTHSNTCKKCTIRNLLQWTRRCQGWGHQFDLDCDWLLVCVPVAQKHLQPVSSSTNSSSKKYWGSSQKNRSPPTCLMFSGWGDFWMFSNTILVGSVECRVSGDCCASLSCGGSFLETLETFGRWDILDNGVLFYLVLNRLTIQMCNYCGDWLWYLIYLYIILLNLR